MKCSRDRATVRARSVRLYYIYSIVGANGGMEKMFRIKVAWFKASEPRRPLSNTLLLHISLSVFLSPIFFFFFFFFFFVRKFAFDQFQREILFF